MELQALSNFQAANPAQLFSAPKQTSLYSVDPTLNPTLNRRSTLESLGLGSNQATSNSPYAFAEQVIDKVLNFIGDLFNQILEKSNASAKKDNGLGSGFLNSLLGIGDNSSSGPSSNPISGIIEKGVGIVNKLFGKVF